MTEVVPPKWRREECRSYVPAGSDRERQYVTYVHDSDDVRLRVAPASLDGDDHPGYALTVTIYPGLDVADSFAVRTVLTFARCDDLAMSFMRLFSSVYSGPATFEDALRYAHVRTRASDAFDAPTVLDGFDEIGGREE